MRLLDAAATAAALPWLPLERAIARTLDDLARGQVHTPDRWVLPVAPGTHWFLMPAWTSAEAGGLAAIKLITYTADNPARGLPAILGDVLVMRAATGERLALLDGPTVTARRTAAVTLLAARHLAAVPSGPLLVVGTGVQATHHVLALVQGLGVREVWVRGRTPLRARAFVQAMAQRLKDASDSSDGRGAVQACNNADHDGAVSWHLAHAAACSGTADAGAGAADADAAVLADALASCPLVVTATTAQAVCLDGPLHPDACVAAIGAFTPGMIELAPALTRQIAAQGRVVIDSDAARHEAGDLLQAGLDMARLPTLGQALATGQSVPQATPGRGPVLFKSCGAALWDLAAARCAVGALPV